MIKGKLEIHPHGEESRKFEVASIEIWNDETCEFQSRGNYEFTIIDHDLIKGEIEHKGRVTHFSRRRSSLALLKEILNSIPEL